MSTEFVTGHDPCTIKLSIEKNSMCYVISCYVTLCYVICYDMLWFIFKIGIKSNITIYLLTNTFIFLYDNWIKLTELNIQGVEIIFDALNYLN